MREGNKVLQNGEQERGKGRLLTEGSSNIGNLEIRKLLWGQEEARGKKTSGMHMGRSSSS